MKLKKAIIGISLAAVFLLSGCSPKEKKADPVLNKTQVVQKMKKGFKSGQVIQSIILGTDTSNQAAIANTTFGGDSTVYHITNQTSSKGKTRSSEEWVNMNNVYINGRDTWYKADLEKLTGHSYADLTDAIMNNHLITNPSAELIKAYKLKRNKNTYTLTAKTSDKALMKKAATPIFDTTPQSTGQAKVFKQIQKLGKYKSMTVKAVVKNNKLATFNVFVNMKLGKMMTVKVGQSYGNFGSHDFLKVPTNATNAKNLPTTDNNKKKKQVFTMKLGIIGSGMIVQDFLTTADQIDNLELTAISSTKRSAGIAQELAQKYNISQTYTDNEELISDSNVDTVYIGVPNFLHYSLAKLALEHGKNVICEKPFVLSTAEAEELKRLADEKDLIIVEAITNIYLENYKKIKEELDNIAPIHIVSLNYTQYSSRYDAFLEGKIAPVFDPKKDGGALMDLNIYNIHLAAGLLGLPDKVKYYANIQKGIDTSGILHLSYPDKQVTLIGSKDSYVTPRSFIEGEKGSIYFDGSTGTLDNFTVEMRGQKPKRYNFNKYPHRMASEFTAFAEMIDQHDVRRADEAFVNTLETMKILTAAKNSVE